MEATAQRERAGIKAVINATGVLLHTNLGVRRCRKRHAKRSTRRRATVHSNTTSMARVAGEARASSRSYKI